jgi:hypothetical protein
VRAAAGLSIDTQSGSVTIELPDGANPYPDQLFTVPQH